MRMRMRTDSGGHIRSSFGAGQCPGIVVVFLGLWRGRGDQGVTYKDIHAPRRVDGLSGVWAFSGLPTGYTAQATSWPRVLRRAKAVLTQDGRRR